MADAMVGPDDTSKEAGIDPYKTERNGTLGS